MTSSDQAMGFDPWGADADATISARMRASGDVSTDLALRQVAHGVETRRQACEAPDGGCETLHCLQVCLVHRLTVPEWLRVVFIQRHQQVTSAQVGTWEEAFGRPWPPRTRLATVRRNKTLVRKIHDLVWRLVSQSQHRTIDRLLFDEIGEMRGIALSGSTVARLYYDGIHKEGLASVADMRSAGPQFPSNSPKDENEFQRRAAHSGAATA